MRTWKQARRAALAVSVVASCAGPEQGIGLPSTQVVYESETLSLSASAGMQPCAGTGFAMDALLDFFRSEGNLPVLDDPVEVYWIGSEEAREVCQTEMEIEGCFFSTGEAVTISVPEEHELIHAYLQNLEVGRTRYSFFDEGLAVVYGTDSHYPAPHTELEQALSFERGLPLQHYPRAGHFVDFLLGEFGPESVIAFVRRSYFVTRESLDREFLLHFGVSLDSVVTAYEAESLAACSSSGWQHSWACETLEPTPWVSDSRWVVDVEAGCDSEVVSGSYGGTLRQLFIFENPEAGPFDIRAVGQVSGPLPTVELVRCGGCEDQQVVRHDLADGVFVGVELPAGRYLVTSAFADEADIQPLQFTLQRRG